MLHTPISSIAANARGPVRGAILDAPLPAAPRGRAAEEAVNYPAGFNTSNFVHTGVQTPNQLAERTMAQVRASLSGPGHVGRPRARPALPAGARCECTATTVRTPL